ALADVTDATNVAAAGAMFDLIDDTTPSLGGPLGVNGKEITGAIDIHSTGDVILELGDNAGVNKVSIKDSDAAEVAAIDSDGDVSIGKLVTTGIVGIGTPDPDAELEIRSAGPTIRLRDTGGTADATEAFIEFGGTDASAWVRTGYVGDSSAGSSNIMLRAEIGDVHIGDATNNQAITISSGNISMLGSLNLQDNTLQRANLLDTSVVTQALSGTGNKTIDLEAGNSVTHTAFGAVTWTFSNPTATNSMSTIFLSLVTGGTGNQTWPTNVLWENGSAPTLLDTQQVFTTDFGVDDKLDITAHGFQNGNRIHATNSGGALPAGLAVDTPYFVINKTTNDFEVSLTLGGSAVDITDDGTGTQTIHSGENKLVFVTDNGGVYWVGIAPATTGITMAAGTQVIADVGDGNNPAVAFGSDDYGFYQTGSELALVVNDVLSV
ncbi:hypothetical protein LCGC14_2704370, partial [marine sediment metagenome]